MKRAAGEGTGRGPGKSSKDGLKKSSRPRIMALLQVKMYFLYYSGFLRESGEGERG